MKPKTPSQSLLDTEDSCSASTTTVAFAAVKPSRCTEKRKTRICKFKKGNWLPEEDELLLHWVTNYGPCKWTQCSKSIKGRCGKQCRERWVNILNPCVKKGKWSHQEQTLIFESLNFHLTAWSTIAKVLPGRTENSIKNYFYSSVRRIQANPISKTIKKKLVSYASSSTPETHDELEKYSEELNVLSRLICDHLLGSEGDGQFYRFLSSHFVEETVKNERILKENKNNVSFLLYPVVQMPKELLTSSGVYAAQKQLSVDTKIFALPKCWNCLGSHCGRHITEVTSI